MSAELLQKAHQSRKSTEHMAKQLLQRLDRSCGMHVHLPGGCSASPWEELSSNSRTARYAEHEDGRATALCGALPMKL